jgi:hypothetical protein
MYELARTPHWILHRDSTRSVVRATRTPVPFHSHAEMEQAFEVVQTALDRVGRSRHGLMVDVREGPFRTDPAFERAFQRHRVAMLTGWLRVAVLVGTAIGKLQINRHAREDGLGVQAFDDEASAFAYAAGRGDSGRPGA